MFRKIALLGLLAMPLMAFQPTEVALPAGNVSLQFEMDIAQEEDGEDNPVIPYGRKDKDDDPDYIEAIRNTASMIWNDDVQQLAAKGGLNLVNVMWEDTGRYYNSAVGPNISDVTIQVQHRDPNSGQYELTLMPVIRYPNFGDQTADIPLDEFYLLVGNQNDNSLHRVTLEEYLHNFRSYLTDPSSWDGRRSSLLAKRDSHALVSAQAAFLPVPAEGTAEFNPVIFNYQSYEGDPAVLVIVATREGTSATVIDNVRDAFPAGWSWGQRLFFNQAGERASFTGERISDFTSHEQPGSFESPEAAGESGLNMVLLIQVPLKQKYPMENEFGGMALEEASAPAEKAEGDTEIAVIGHGEVEGPFTEIDGLAIERDPRFPIRVTVQFYKATSTGVVTPEDMQAIANQIDRVYEDGEYVGSLVLDGASDRPTEYDGSKEQPDDWWEVFWNRFEENTGLDQWDAMELFEALKIVAGSWIRSLR